MIKLQKSYDKTVLKKLESSNILYKLILSWRIVFFNTAQCLLASYEIF